MHYLTHTKKVGKYLERTNKSALKLKVFQVNFFTFHEHNKTRNQHDIPFNTYILHIWLVSGQWVHLSRSWKYSYVVSLQGLKKK